MRLPLELGKGFSSEKTKNWKIFHHKNLFLNLRLVALGRKKIKWPSMSAKRFVPAKNQNGAILLKKPLQKVA